MTAGTTTLTIEQAAAAFNEWMRLYTEAPERFEREWQVVVQFLADTSAGIDPDYGASCARFLASLAIPRAPAVGGLE